MPDYSGMTLRPYQIVCAVCSLGEDNSAADPTSSRILETVRKSPDIPISLRCNAGEVFTYQDPGAGEDTPGGAEFNLRRDLEILYKLNLHPGCTLPARIIFSRLLDTIEDVSMICDCSATDAQKRCPKIENGSYQRGREKGIDAIIPPRIEQDMRRDKEESLDAMHKVEAKSARPHILLCSVCQYGRGTRPPYPEDNLPELVELALEEPDTLITLAPHADWMMCAPCPYRSSELNACVNNKGSGGLPNQMRDLRVLHRLGLTYGSTLKARDLYKLIFERISGTLEICRIEHSRPSVWWTGCGAATADSEDYEEGKKLLIAAFG